MSSKAEQKFIKENMKLRKEIRKQEKLNKKYRDYFKKHPK